MPKSRQWGIFLEREAELEDEFSHAPTIDLASRVIDGTTTIFKAASCSLKMKSGLVKALKETAATTRAAMTILARRARENEVAAISDSSEREQYFERQIEALKNHVKRLEEKVANGHSSSTVANRPRRRACEKAPIIESDTKMGVTPAPPTLRTEPPSPSPLTGNIRGKNEGGMKASHVAIGYCNGPSLGGVPRQVEAYPPEISTG